MHFRSQYILIYIYTLYKKTKMHQKTKTKYIFPYVCVQGMLILLNNRYISFTNIENQYIRHSNNI